MAMSVLIVDDELNMRKILSALLTREGYRVVAVEDGFQAITALASQDINIVLSDLKMPVMDGLTLLDEIRQINPLIPVILLTAHGTIGTAVDAMKHGAFDFVTKPFETDELKHVIAKAARVVELAAREPRQDAASRINDLGMIGNSASVRELRRIVQKVAAGPSTVLITGETGTGKELVATALHQQSPRAKNPFIKINCASIPETLIESELFGYERGAFTGAVASKPGRFELADGGSLFLDEVGELPKEIQAKLLRAIQECAFERVGGVRTIKVDVRIIAATNRELETMVRKGDFRLDLYYRLNIIPIHLPPLRHRREDIPLLIEHFITKFNKRLGKSVLECSPDALELLSAYEWPGNIRELENLMERSVLLSDADVIGAEDLRIPQSSPGRLGESDSLSDTARSLKDLVRQRTEILEISLIKDALKDTAGNVTRAAQKLQISRKSLQLKMKEYGLRGDE